MWGKPSVRVYATEGAENANAVRNARARLERPRRRCATGSANWFPSPERYAGETHTAETHTAARELPVRMYRAILPNGQLEAEEYEHVENGVELYDEDHEMLAFVPYANLEALLTEAAYERDAPDVM